jgi:hypothetical protein|tara:strand:+ start:811 stop:1035 length:225 start_codon:yes stop_codon:yes gene_type:complete
MRRRKLATENLGSIHPLWHSGTNETFTQVAVWEYPPSGFDGKKELLAIFMGPFAKINASKFAHIHRNKSVVDGR